MIKQMLKAIINRLRGKTKVYSTSNEIRGSWSSGRKDQNMGWFHDI